MKLKKKTESKSKDKKGNEKLEKLYDKSDANFDEERYEVKNDNINPSMLVPGDNTFILLKLPLIFYVFLLTVIFFIVMFIYYIKLLVQKESDHEDFNNYFERPPLNKNKYRIINFNNNLELLLVQVGENNTAGGAIVIDKGYLNDPYQKGLTQYAINSLLSNDTVESTYLVDYFGDFQYSTDEFHSDFRFKILNDGFFKYLKEFSKILNLDENIHKYSSSFKKNKMKIAYNSDIKNIRKKERHLLQYLVYGYIDKNGLDILPQGNEETLNWGGDDYLDSEAKSILKTLVKPSKIKIVLLSHYKLSLMEAKFKTYFKYLIEMKNEKGKHEDEGADYIVRYFKKKKIISFLINDHETNYIKINYYLERINYENYSSLYLQSQYFNYIKYILDETKEGSLYYRLTNSSEFNIKSLSSNFDIILKNKIKFTIKIELNSYSYEHIQDILFITYEHMDKIVKYVRDITEDDERYKELQKILKQKFIFSEVSDEAINVAKRLGVNLFKKKSNYSYFLNEQWIPDMNYNNLKEMKSYFKQLNPENSVVIIGLRNDTLDKIDCQNNNSLLILDCEKLINFNNKTRYFNLSYSYDDLDTSFIKYFDKNKYNRENENNDEIDISFIPNEYVSNYSKIIDVIGDDETNYELPKEIFNNTLRKFYYKRDTSYKIPKVHISLNFLHPYLRPKPINNKPNECLFFDIILFLSYVDREIRLRLGDAIRAGNLIQVNYNENQLYIEVFAFSDVVEKIISKIKEIVLDTNILKNPSADGNIFFEKNKIYEDAVFEDFLNFENINFDLIAKFYLFSFLGNNLFNKYLLSKDLFANRKDSQYEECKNNLEKDIQIMNNFIIICQIFGNYEEEAAKNISRLFELKDQDINHFKISMYEAGYEEKDIVPEDFQKWVTKINDLDVKEKYTIDRKILEDHKENAVLYRFLFWSKYNIDEYIKVSLLNSMLSNGYENDKYIFSSSFFLHNGTYFEFKVKKKNGIIIEDNLDFLSDIIDDLFKTIDKNYKEKVDNIGDRFYYLGKSFIQAQNMKKENMRQYAIENLNNIFFTDDNIKWKRFDESIKIITQDDIIDLFKKNIKKKPYLDVFPENL